MPSYMHMYMIEHKLLLVVVEEIEDELPRIKVCLRRNGAYLCESMQLLDLMRLIWRFAKLLEKVVPEASRKLNEKVHLYIEEFAKERVISANSLEEAIEQFEKQIIEENIRIWRLQGTVDFLNNYVSAALRWLEIDLAIFIGDIIKLEDEENVDRVTEDNLLLEVEPEKEELPRIKICIQHNCVTIQFIEFLKLTWKFAKALEDAVFKASCRLNRQVYLHVQEFAKEKVIDANSIEEAIKQLEHEIRNENKRIWEIEKRIDLLNSIHSVLYELRIKVACLLNYIDELEDEEERRMLDENDMCRDLEEDDC